ncbi:MAG: hypothetical protein COU07_01395 [Candidatus Harrisonbacteria bacterium CG10_big_fil_rev_8_21_14_0_10_40_38]|uniref:Uncharacterized protein n=1 Tax=Candidatus Harrisonbacteria bacterium CG10_big_fil_rev_8_21_14_0_10_40_38 TaxID=1974583 RepID=A0A2H0UV49_9BACT|nr:MAG: hypothetical protein COU07_01395 [Candidatus Harrisonbacteria bacterium CG10_big_fil_rev_8_21_14_0_10_40_38]
MRANPIEHKTRKKQLQLKSKKNRKLRHCRSFLPFIQSLSKIIKTSTSYEENLISIYSASIGASSSLVPRSAGILDVR